MLLDKNLLNDILSGATFLGSGGGGSVKAGEIFLEVIGDKKINLITDKDKFNKQDLGCVVCDIGSITAFDDNQDEALDFAFKLLKERFKEKQGVINTLFPIETGPENTMAPFVLASKHGLNVYDADGAGRAIPTLPLCTYMAEDIPNIKPIAMANGLGDVSLVSTVETKRLEVVLRNMASTDTFSSSASLALWPNKVEELAKKSITGTITKCMYCGQLLKLLKNNEAEYPEKILKSLNELKGFIIAKGKVIYKSSSEGNAFNFTTTKIKNEYDNAIITVLSQNESLVVFSDLNYAPLAIVPDSICWLTYDFLPCTNAEILETSQEEEYLTQYVYLIGIKAYTKLKNKKIISGFRNIIRDLGYAGNLNIKTPPTKPLGKLLIDLKKT